MDVVLQSLAALAPSVGVGVLFWWVMRTIMQADRRERAALARLDAEAAQREAPSALPVGTQDERPVHD